MTTAVVLSGGANLGAVHVGMLRALIEADLRPDMIVGTSVGAINGVYMSSRWNAAGVDGLDDLWSGMSRSTIFPTRLLGGLLGFIGRRDHLVPADGLRRLVKRHAEFTRLEDSPIPLHVVATNLLTGIDRRISSGPAIEAVLASAAIPAVFLPDR
jgi:NTE family protein